MGKWVCKAAHRFPAACHIPWSFLETTFALFVVTGLPHNWLAHPHASSWIWCPIRSGNQTGMFEVLHWPRLKSDSGSLFFPKIFFPQIFLGHMEKSLCSIVANTQAHESYMLGSESQLLQVIAVWPRESHLTCVSDLQMVIITNS